MTPDHNSLVSFMKALLNNLRQDIARLHLAHSKEIHRDFDRLQARLENEGLPFITSTLPSLGKAILQSFRTGVLETPQGFRRKKGTTLPLFMSGLLVQGYDSSGQLDVNVDAQVIRSLMQVCFLAYKLELPFTKGQIETKLNGFLLAEKDLRDLNLDASDPILSAAGSYIREIFREFNPREITPGHGPGAVATGEKEERKWVFKRKYEHLHKVYPYYEYFVPSRASLLGKNEDGGINPLPFLNWYKSLESCSYATSQVRFVPKDSRGPRIISMEALEVQFIQQGLKDSLYSFIERHPLLKGFVNFSKQTINQELALAGSATGEWATLDMKEASDRVSLSLVKTLFHGTPLLEALLAVRSQYAQLPKDVGEHSGKVVELMKYAPMGSAVCFPVEAVVFWALSKAIIAYEHGELNVLPKVPVYVYGDDVILPTTYAELLIRKLPEYGLKVNADKSYYTGPFRESCGFDCFAGKVVTPIKMRKLWPCSQNVSARLLESFSDYAIGFRAAGYMETYKFLINLPALKKLSRTRLPGALAIPGDDIVPRKWDERYDRYIVKVTTKVGKSRLSELKGERRLLANLTGRFTRRYEDPHASNSKLRWMPEYGMVAESFKMEEGKPLPPSFGGNRMKNLELSVLFRTLAAKR